MKKHSSYKEHSEKKESAPVREEIGNTTLKTKKKIASAEDKIIKKGNKK